MSHPEPQRTHGVHPIPFDPSFEEIQPDEAETSAALVEAMRSILETTFKDYGHAVRSVHAKSHGLLKGELTVSEGLPPELSQGLFARPARYPVVLRFSTNPGDILDDSISVPRGVAMKVIGVEGDRLPGSEGAEQDFVMVNGPAFVAPGPKEFLKSLKLLAATTDTPQALKKVASAALRGAESVVEAFGGKSPTLLAMGGHPNTNILGETFYTQVPHLYGAYVAKLSLAPFSASLKALKDAKIDVSGHPNAIRDAVMQHFADGSGEWELRAQLLTDRETMPVEDASVHWPEEVSPYLAVARLIVGPQPGWSEERARIVDDAMSFSPWHGLAAHRPLGAVMRSRKASYEMSTSFRSAHNGCPILHPRSEAEIGF